MTTKEEQENLKSILFKVQMIPAIYFLLLFINNILYLNGGVSSLTIIISRITLFAPFIYFIYFMVLLTKFSGYYFDLKKDKREGIYLFGILSGLMYFFHFIPFILGCLITINIVCIFILLKNKSELRTATLLIINTILVIMMLFINVK